MEKLQILQSFIFLVTGVKLCFCAEETVLYDTSGSKEFGQVGAKISLSSPIHFYDEKFQAIHPHTNGYVTFADEKVWAISYFNQNKVMAPCMVEIQDNNKLGFISVLVSNEEYQLNRATADVIAHFATEADFVATEVVIITWNGLLSQDTTIQNVIIIGEKRTFALFLFKNTNKLDFESQLRNLDAKAGFSNGDRVRITELLDFRVSRGIKYLFEQSNTMVAGKWIFMIGSTDKAFFQIRMPDTFSVYEPSLGKLVRKDVNECKERISACHRFADCQNTDPGYKCTCIEGYFGNGRVCLQKDSVVNVEGKLSGKINHFSIGKVDLAAYISKRSGELFVSISSVSPRTGHSLQMIPPMTGLLGWLFGTTIVGKSGLDIVGNRFKSTSIIIFQTGEILYITQEMKGYDSFNNLMLDTQIKGYMPIPLTSATSIQSIKPYMEKYAIGQHNVMYSEGSAAYVVDGRSINYTVNRLIKYEPTSKNMDYKAIVNVTETVSSFFEGNDLLRFRQKYSITQTTSKPTQSPTTVKKIITPDSTSRQSTDERMKLISTTERPKEIMSEQQKARELNEKLEELMKEELKRLKAVHPTTLPQVTTLKATATTILKATKTTLEATTTSPRPTTSAYCDGEVCSKNATCRSIDGQKKCVCKEGFIGNGSNCAIDKRIKCGTYRCDQNAECIKEQSQYFCKCKKGFVGDGIKCQINVPCRCDINAECYRDNKGGKYCVCKLGFRGDGKQCKDIDECKETKIVCQSHSKCINTIGSYDCICNKGFRKNNSKCLDIPECTEISDACGKGAICTEIPGSYKCSCPKGFHFGYRNRDCFPDCPRCLNGGTCIGKFGCKCPSGYSGEICQWVGEEFLLYAQGGNIKRFSYPYEAMSYGYIYRNNQHLMVGVDYDCKDKKVYWTDVTSGSIQRSNYDGTAMEIVVSGLRDPQGLTIDWLGRNLFWTDNGLNKVQVSSLNGKIRKTLFKDGLRYPRPIICNPYTGQLFWGDWDRRRPRIEVSSMDGTGRRILVSRRIGLPNGLTIDYKARDLCWTDAAFQALSCIGLDGRNQRILNKQVGYPFGITIHDSMIYWSNWVTDNIGRFDKQHNKAMNEVRSGYGIDGKLLDIKSVTACPARKNLCSFNNGGCSHICLMRVDGGRTCACPSTKSGNEAAQCVENR